jgi:hypothetical protein
MKSKLLVSMYLLLVLTACETKDSTYSSADSINVSTSTDTNFNRGYSSPGNIFIDHQQSDEDSVFNEQLKELTHKLVDKILDEILEDIKEHKVGEAEQKYTRLKTEMNNQHFSGKDHKTKFEQVDVELSLAKIYSSKYGELPAAEKQGSKISATTSISIENGTGYVLTVSYRGPDFRQVIILPGETETFQMRSGSYQIGASVSASSVMNYAGSEEFTGGPYSYRYYIRTSTF